jgi:hypothetical protein
MPTIHFGGLIARVEAVLAGGRNCGGFDELIPSEKDVKRKPIPGKFMFIVSWQAKKSSCTL